MLMDLMDVEESEIVDWYLSQVDVENTTYMIKEVIKDFIAKQLHPELVQVAEVVEKEIPQELVANLDVQEEAPKAKTKKTTTKKK